MGFRNDTIPAGTVVVTASASAVDYVGLLVISSSDLTYIDDLGATTTLTAVPAGVNIICRIRKVTTCSGVVLAYKSA